MKKVDENKKIKHDSLLEAAFNLFLKKGFAQTSISDIVERAGVAKGTFYLYFSDKYDIRNKLISFKAGQIFKNAYNALPKHERLSFEDQIIFIIDHILDQFLRDKGLVVFLSKHLSWAFFKKALNDSTVSDNDSVLKIYEDMLDASGFPCKNPEIMIYMIIELIGSASYNAIVYRQPVPLEELKPFLYEAVRNIIHQFRSQNRRENDLPVELL